MAAYVIVDIQITDPKGYEEYRKLAPPSLEAYGGTFVVRGGHAENLEGDWNPQRIVVLKFPSVDKAKEWLNSPEYEPARDLRWQTARSKMIVVEGVPE